MWGWLTAIVQGIVTPLLTWWATYEQGKNAQKLEDAQATLAQQQAVADAHAAAGNVTVDADWLRRDSIPPPAAGSDPSVPPGAPR